MAFLKYFWSSPWGIAIAVAAITFVAVVIFGNVPGWLVGATDAVFGAEGDIDHALEDIELKHSYTPTLTEGQVRIDGVLKP